MKKEFDEKYKQEAQKYLERNLEGLREANPGQIFRYLKRLFAKPGDCADLGTFTLPNYESENLTDQQVAERLADYFAAISSDYPPLATNLLPTRVQEKLRSLGKPPKISEYDTYCKMKAAKKPRSGVPGDLPKQVNQEFLVELSAPVSRIINSMFQSYEWPAHWKIENVIPVANKTWV